MTINESKVTIIIDANLMAHKAYAALNLSLEDGTPTSILYGMLRQLTTINRKFNPDQIILAWDGGSTKRKLLYPAYKANRPSQHNGFHQQILIAEQVFFDLGIPQILVPGEEADDLIGSYCFNNKDEKIIIVTCDHDFYQLVSENIWVYSYSGQNSRIYTEQVVKEIYGIEPSNLVDLFALTGDATDNVEGLKRIGKKTAGKIIQKYQNIENLLQQTKLGGFSKSIEESIFSSKEQIILNKKILAIDQKVPYIIRKGEKNLELVKKMFLEYFRFHYFVNNWSSIIDLSKNNLENIS